MSFPIAPPLPASLGAPEVGEHSVAGKDVAGPPPLTDSTGFIQNSKEQFSTNIWGKTVKQLSLSEALSVPDTTSIYEARFHMATQRADVILLTDSNALLTGILTNKDIATRVIPHELDLVNTPVSKVMTNNPLFVLSDTLVVEALRKMVQGQVTQLPVLENDKVIGLVSRELCLFDGIVEDAVQRVTQRDLTVKELGQHYGSFELETTTIYKACIGIASRDGNEIVVISNSLCSGILTKKDIVSRVIPRGIDIVKTHISEVVMKKPIFMLCDSFSMEDLQTINAQGEIAQFLVKEDNGFVYQPLCLRGGVLPTTGKTAENHNVIDAPQHTAVRPKKQPSYKPLPDENSSTTWNHTSAPSLTSFMRVTNSLYTNVDPYNELVDHQPPQHTAMRPLKQSLSDVNGNITAGRTEAPSFTPFVRMNNSPYPQDTYVRPPEKPSDPLVGVNALNPTNSGSSTNIRGSIEEMTVKQLPLSEALTVPETTTIYEACCQMAARRADVLVLIDSNDLLTGILTNKDIIRRVITCDIDLVNTPVLKVMTKNPTFVVSDTLVVEALQKLVEKNFTQLPVIENGKVIGFFDQMGNNLTKFDNHNKVIEAAVRMARGIKVKQLPLEHALTVPETTTIYEACCQMAAERVEAVVVTDSNAFLKGVLTKKDILLRVIPSGIDFVNTPLSKVMKKKQIFVSWDALHVEALEYINLSGMSCDLLVLENAEDDGLVYLPLYIYSIEWGVQQARRY